MSNITLNLGSGGSVLGTDQVAGAPNVDYQIIKIGYSVSGAAPTQVSASAPLPVVQTGALPAGGNVIGAVTQSGGPWTANLTQAAGTALDVNSGNKSAGTIRVVIATDQPSLSNAQPVSQSGSWTVAGTGNFAITAASLPLPTGAALDASVTGLQVAQASATAGQKGGLTLAAAATSAPSYTNAQTNPLSLTLAGGLRCDLSSVAGTATDVNSGNKSAGTIRVVIATDQPSLSNALAVTQSGTWTVQIGNTPNSTPILVTDTPATSGGLSFSYQLAPATPTKTAVKASAGQIFSITCFNINAAARYLKLWNIASAGVTLGTTACTMQVLIPGNTAGAGVVINIDKGWTFGTAITAAITGGIADADNTAISANEVIVTIGFK